MSMEEKKFELISKYSPCGDQPQAIERLVDGINAGYRTQVLKGVTGSGKTFTMACVINRLNRPALIISHNKTLAAQLCNEFREFFPNNRVEFFVSYYDYYMPESYLPSRDLYIEKELTINDEIDKLRHSATCSLFERKDTIVVASVSCIYGLGAPSEFYKMSLSLRPGQALTRDKLISSLVEVQYKRNDIDFHRGTFRVRGDIVEIFPSANNDIALRVEFFGDTIDTISEFEAITGKKVATLLHGFIFPATHYIYENSTLESVLDQIRKDMDEQVEELKKQEKIVEAQRLKQRVSYDLEMLKEMGYCSGVENYSRYFDGRKKGQTPYTLLDYFSEDFITFVDESHMTLPQVRGMYNGDKSRKQNLVDYGFRLESAFDNRPLRFDEFDKKIGQMICVSATPNEYEIDQSGQVVEQLIRPTGLVDPEIVVNPVEGQIDDLISKINTTVNKGGRVLVTTLTKRMSESLTTYLTERAIRVKYMHSDIETLERIEIINGLKNGEFDVLVGINLLREGLDLPQVKLVAILDADKEGFLRSEQALIQTIGRAARNIDGKVIMYADVMTGSMKRAIDETNRRRKIQNEYNLVNKITPKTIEHNVKNSLEITKKEETKFSKAQLPAQIEILKVQMKQAANSLDFEKAILLREQVGKLEKQLKKYER